MDYSQADVELKPRLVEVGRPTPSRHAPPLSLPLTFVLLAVIISLHQHELLGESGCGLRGWTAIDPLNLIWVMPAQGSKKTTRFELLRRWFSPAAFLFLVLVILSRRRGIPAL
jgi:hypothetical protein